MIPTRYQQGINDQRGTTGSEKTGETGRTAVKAVSGVHREPQNDANPPNTILPRPHQSEFLVCLRTRYPRLFLWPTPALVKHATRLLFRQRRALACQLPRRGSTLTRFFLREGGVRRGNAGTARLGLTPTFGCSFLAALTAIDRAFSALCSWQTPRLTTMKVYARPFGRTV